mgnify:CR=1 FL=1
MFPLPVKGFVHRGGGLIGVGEPGGHQYQGRYLQLAAPLGVEKETGFTLNYDKYNWTSTVTTSSWPTAPTTTWTSARAKRVSLHWRAPTS